MSTRTPMVWPAITLRPPPAMPTVVVVAAWIETPVGVPQELGRATSPVTSVPIRFPSTAVPETWVPSTSTSKLTAPLSTLPSPGAVPPMVLPDALPFTITPAIGSCQKSWSLGEHTGRAVPPFTRPMMLPWTELLLAPLV